MLRNGGTAKLSMVASSFGVAPLQHFGAIVEGPLDLRGVLSGDGAASMASELQSALDANGGLLVFRDQRNFGPEQHVALAELLGEIFPLPLRFQHARSPMPGKILEVKVADGQTVEAGELLLVMEAMKMEHRIVAPTDGVVTKVNFSMGDQVQQGDVLVEMGE